MKVYLIGTKKFSIEDRNNKKKIIPHIFGNLTIENKAHKEFTCYFLGYTNINFAKTAVEFQLKVSNERPPIIELEIDDQCKNQILTEDEKIGLNKIPVFPGTKIISAFFEDPKFEVQFSELPEHIRRVYDGYLEVGISSNQHFRKFTSILNPSMSTNSPVANVSPRNGATFSQSQKQTEQRAHHYHEELANSSKNIIRHNHIPQFWNSFAKAFFGLIATGMTLYLFNFSLSSLCLGAILGCAIIKTTLYFIDLIACNKAQILEQNIYKMTISEMNAFQTGVLAAQSNKGFFKAWLIKESYTEYPSYAAAKHLVENGKKFNFRV
ncbi:MAG: hypothetical protein JSS07_07390 [Proteobacteria bacterium]|nr:hypothetical protein [Pseudomonadota bacterium]